MRSARNSPASRSRKCTPRSPRSATPIRSRSIRTSSATCPTAPAPSSAATTARWRCSPRKPTTCSTAKAPATTWRAIRRLGQFVPEGSKSGAAAAAVYVTHRVLPLDHAHFGQLPRQTVLAAEAFHARAETFAANCADVVHACVPFAPDSNLVCLALNPPATARRATNAFVRRLHEELRCDPQRPLQVKEFFGSMTTLRPEVLGKRCDVARAGAWISPDNFDGAADRLVILRHTLMNPYLIDSENGISYIDRYFEFLERRIAQLCAPAAA